ncbi:hypothetical protein [Halobacillus ihumii]|uniref:hypothetical protein n=1 Tax=Halobacillus ihumii TaxID=2686092 RepID=UPI0013D76AD6|nr:hypothetical protein [Halobacillus ihumii]
MIVVSKLEQIRDGIKKQQDLWALYRKTLPTKDMLPGEKRKCVARCREIIGEISEVREQVNELDRRWKEERHRGLHPDTSIQENHHAT